MTNYNIHKTHFHIKKILIQLIYKNIANKQIIHYKQFIIYLSFKEHIMQYVLKLFIMKFQSK